MNKNNFEKLSPVPFEGRDIELVDNFSLTKIFPDGYLALLNKYEKAIFLTKGLNLKR